jgi:adenylate kinase
MTKQPMHLIVFGAQLSGKGTQADNIAKHYGLAHLTTGGILREMFAHGDAKTKALLEPSILGGKLLSDEEMNPILTKYLDGIKTGWVLDGYPRTLPQAEFINGYLEKHNQKLTAGILVSISKEEIAKRRDYRIKTEGRVDDKDDAALDFRLRQFFEKTIPAIDYFKHQGLVIEINGMQTREAVFEEIKRKMQEFLKSTQ